MKWRSTFWLVGIAFGLLAYIWFAERHTPSTADRQASQRLLSEFRAIEVDTVQVQRTNSFILQVQRTNEGWEYLAPFSYPGPKALGSGSARVRSDLKPRFSGRRRCGGGHPRCDQ
jgi:hypothetical protein